MSFVNLVRTSCVVTCAVMLLLASCARPARTSGDAATADPAYSAQVINPALTGALIVPGSRRLLIWGTDGSVLTSMDGSAWEHARTPVARDIARIASDAGGATLVAVGAHGSILRSSDAGLHWQLAANDVTDTDLAAVIHHTRSGSWIAAGSNGRILRSLDDARTWTVIGSPLNLNFRTLFVDPATQLLLVGGDDGVVGSSTDGGATWHLTWISMPPPVTPITAFQRYGTTLIAASALGRFLLSHDDAHSWDLMQSATRAFFTDSAFDPQRHAIVMIGHDGTLLRSRDDGVSWQAGSLDIEGRTPYLSTIRYDEHDQSMLVTGHGGTLARSTDGGTHWQLLNPGANDDFEGLLLNDAGRIIAFGNGGSIMLSAGPGERWTSARNNLDLYLRDVAALPDDTLIATGQLGDIVRSTDGVHWQRIPIEYPDPHTPPDLRALVRAGDSLIAAGPPGAILRSSADGSQWTLLQWTPLAEGRALAWIVSDRSRNALLTVEAHGAMYRSGDDGMQWRAVNAAAAGEFWHGAALEGDGVMVIAGKSGSAARSLDAGLSWSPVSTGTDRDLFGSFADEERGTLFLLGEQGTLLRSTDRGATWQPLPSATTHSLRRMLKDPRSGALVAFGACGAIVKSADGGVTWRVVNSGVAAELRDGTTEPRTRHLLIAGRSGTLLRSADGGDTWERLPGHTLRHFTSLTTRPNGDVIAVGERIVKLSVRTP